MKCFTLETEHTKINSRLNFNPELALIASWTTRPCTISKLNTFIVFYVLLFELGLIYVRFLFFHTIRRFLHMQVWYVMDNRRRYLYLKFEGFCSSIAGMHLSTISPEFDSTVHTMGIMANYLLTFSDTDLLQLYCMYCTVVLLNPDVERSRTIHFHMKLARRKL